MFFKNHLISGFNVTFTFVCTNKTGCAKKDYKYNKEDMIQEPQLQRKEKNKKIL